MMMAQPFPAHQGIPQHGMPPGHPMPAQHPNAGHPGPGMVQQIHPGASAPGGPQASQAGPMMGGMPPGASTAGPGGPMPNAHALSHLNPAQAHLFQQQGFPQNFANNPQLLQQHQQQQQLIRHRMMYQAQQQQQQQQQQQHGGIPVSLPNGTQGSASQLAAMQANPGMRPVNLQHLQHQMPHGQPQNISQQQLYALQQAHAHQAQQAQQNNAGQPGQHTPQRGSAQPPNMHEAQSATPQSQHGPPPTASGTPQPNQPGQPPSTQPPQTQGGPPQTQGTPHTPAQQLPQSHQGQQPGQVHPGAQHQPSQGAHGQPGQQSGPPSQQPMTAQEAQLKAQQHQNANAIMMQQQRMSMKGATILYLNMYAEHLGNFQSRGEAHDLLYWQSFVDQFYSPGGVLRQGVYNPQAGSKQFEIATPALARYYLTQFTSGIRHIQMVVEGARERDSPNGGHIVDSPRTSFIYWFTNDSQLFTNGTLRAHFDMNNKIEMLDIIVTNHTEFIPRSQLLALEAAEQKQSPKVTKNAAKRAQKQAPQPSLSLPESMVTANGVPTPVMGFLEVAETISQMQMLFQFSQQNPQLSPPEALRGLVTTLQTQKPNSGYAGGAMGPGMQPGPNARPPMNGPSQFASPGMAHLGLPGAQGSPHLTGSAHGSPAQSQLTGPPGMQAGVQPSPAGVGNSPNVGGNNKRRRASTIKRESEEGGGSNEVNGTAPPTKAKAKVSASPRVPKRQKGQAT